MESRGRFAPSPTGELHLGSAATAVLCAASARASGGRLVLRIEDLDSARVVSGATQGIVDDLRWLGVRWDEGPDVGGACGPYVQSERASLYERALLALSAAGHTYLCDCSRADIARVASAPHAGDEGPRYSRSCRRYGMSQRAFRRPPAVRLAVPDGAVVTTHDAVLGTSVEDVGEQTGDFVLRRGDGVFAYQLAVVVDDLLMGITSVVRGADLASSAARQVLLAELLGGKAPTFAHVPLVEGEDGGRLSKRGSGVTIRAQRALGRDPRELVRAVARAYGHGDLGKGPPLDAFASVFDFAKLRGCTVRADDLAFA